MSTEMLASVFDFVPVAEVLVFIDIGVYLDDLVDSFGFSDLVKCLSILQEQMFQHLPWFHD